MTLIEDRPIRVLHILASLGHGGIETWLMHILRRADRSKVRHEVLLLKPAAGAYEAEAESLGIKVHRANGEAGRFDLLRRLNALLAEHRFDVVHSHMYMFSGLVLGVAARHRVPMRIAHCHHAAITQGFGGPLARIEHRVLRSLIGRFATLKLGISENAIAEISGDGWQDQPNCKILFYGFDFSRYDGAQQRALKLRTELALGGDAKIVGHVGRFVQEKNHGLLLRVFAELVRRCPDAKLVLVGAGPLRAETEALAQELGIDGSVVFAGTTNDVPAYMAMFHVFVLTSTSEGLGIVVLEAQAAGTASVISNVVPHEVNILSELLERAELTAPERHWAGLIERRLMTNYDKDPAAWRKLEQSRFGIERCLAELEGYYRGTNA